MAGKKGMKHYSRELQERAVHMALDEGMGYAAITQAQAIRDLWRVRRWVQAYRKEGAHAFDRPKGRPRKSASPRDELERLRMENGLLKKYHSELCKLALATRNIGSSTTRGQRIPRPRCAPSLACRGLHTMLG